MKQLVLCCCFLIMFACGTASAQTWNTGPMSAPPPIMGAMPGPEMGVQPLMPPCGMGPAFKSCLGPASAGFIIGYQPNSDPAQAKFSTRGTPVFGAVGTNLEFNLEGLWLGASIRMPVMECLGLRVEGRALIPTAQSVSTTTQLDTGLPGARAFTTSTVWRLLDGSAQFQFAPNFALVGGVRYDYFDVHMTNPGNIQAFSSNSDEGDFTVGSVIPYLGIEAAWTNCVNGIMLRAIGTPILSTYTTYGLTYGDSTGGPSIRDSYSGTPRYATFYEASLNVGRKFGTNITLGGYTSVQAISAHSQREFRSSRMAPAALDISQTFDLDFNRRSIVFGGTASYGFASPF